MKQERILITLEVLRLVNCDEELKKKAKEVMLKYLSEETT